MSSRNMTNLLKILKANARIGKTTLLISDPGMGKSALVQSLAAEMADEEGPLPVHTLTGSQHDPADFSGYPYVEGAEADRYMAFLPIKFARELEKSGRGILFLDELSTAAESQQAAMLRLLQERTVGEVKLPDSVVLIAAANPTTSGTSAWNFSPPFANRICHVSYEPDKDDWERGLISNWGQPADEYDRSWLMKVATFLRAYPLLLHKMPEDDTSQGRAWPSHRTWHNSALALAAIDREGELEDEVSLLLLTGWVGEAAATGFIKWSDGYDLPDVFDLLDNYDLVDWDQTDKAYVMAIAAVDAVGRHKPSSDNTDNKDTPSVDTTEKVIGLIRHIASEGHVDIATAVIRDFIQNTRKRHPNEKEMRSQWLMDSMKHFGGALEAMGLDRREKS